MSENDGIKEFAKYPLSLTILGAIVIITAGIVNNVDLTKIVLCVCLLLILFIVATVFNGWWFKVGRFSTQLSPALTSWQVFSSILGWMGIILMVMGLGAMIIGYLSGMSNTYWEGVALVALGLGVLAFAVTTRDIREIKELLQAIKR